MGMATRPDASANTEAAAIHLDVAGDVPAPGSPATRLTEAEVEGLVRADYESLVGKVVLIDSMICSNGNDATDPVAFDPPALGRVLPSHSEANFHQDVLRWMDEDNCDPAYEVEILEPHPAFAGLRPYFAHGASRSTRPGYVDPRPDFRLAPPDLQERYRDAPALDGSTLGACSPEGLVSKVERDPAPSPSAPSPARTPVEALPAEAVMAVQREEHGLDDADEEAAVSSCTDFARRHGLRLRLDHTVLVPQGRMAAMSLAGPKGEFVAIPVELDGLDRPDMGVGRVLLRFQAIALAADLGALEGEPLKGAKAVLSAISRVLPDAVLAEYLEEVGIAHHVRGTSSPSP